MKGSITTGSDREPTAHNHGDRRDVRVVRLDGLPTQFTVCMLHIQCQQDVEGLCRDSIRPADY